MIKFAYSGAIAAVILYVGTPFLPTILLIQPVNLEIEDGLMKYTRTVTAPTFARHQTEVTMGRQIFPQCNASGHTLFEKRENLEPVEWVFPCTLPDGEYNVEVCVAASFWGLEMRPACISGEWYVGPKPLELREQLEILQKEVDALQLPVQK